MTENTISLTEIAPGFNLCAPPTPVRHAKNLSHNSVLS